MRGSITLALQGHEKHATKTDKVMNYVLWGLVGQRVVRTSQLSSAIAEALRGMHDIAYLRWVAIGKELELSQLHDEAIALVTHPSPRLSISTYDQTRPPARPGDLQQSREQAEPNPPLSVLPQTLGGTPTFREDVPRESTPDRRTADAARGTSGSRPNRPSE